MKALVIVSKGSKVKTVQRRVVRPTALSMVFVTMGCVSVTLCGMGKYVTKGLV